MIVPFPDELDEENGDLNIRNRQQEENNRMENQAHNNRMRCIFGIIILLIVANGLIFLAKRD